MSLPEPPSQGYTHPAASNYGKACTNCSKAKCKCSYSEGKAICERCERLNKDCKPLVAVRKRNVRPTGSTAAKQQRLEQKLDSLVSLLQAQGSVIDTSNVSSENSVQSPSSEWSSKAPESVSRLSASKVAPHVALSAPSASTAPTSPEDYDGPLGASSPDAQKVLDRFRTQALEYLPFIYIQPHMTALQLSNAYPTLWMALSAAGARTMSESWAVSKQLMTTLTEKVYHDGDRSIDLLFATIVLVGWFYQQRKLKPFFNAWGQLASTLATELGLNKSTPDTPMFTYSSVWPYTAQPPRRERTMLERRAVLATFLLTSWVSNSFRKNEALKWTSHMDDCLRILEQQPEWEGDIILALQVRCALVVELATDSPWMGTILNDGTKPGAPEQFTKSLNIQLQEVRGKLNSLSSQPNLITRLALLNAELTMYEAAQELPLTLDKAQVVEPRKLEPFFQSLNTIKAYLELFFKMPYTAYSDSGLSVFSQFIHMIVALFRLNTLVDPAWDRVSVKESVDVIAIVTKFASNLDLAREMRGLAVDNNEPDLYAQTATMMRTLAGAWSAEINDAGERDRGQSQPIGEVDMSQQLMDWSFLDNEWLAGMFMTWDR